jgi:hypothetical protein
MLFPCDNENMTPMDFVPKKSNVACVLQCGGLWFGGKGWGITWKLVQCVVKPQETQSVYGRCHIQLSSDELQTIEKQEIAPAALDDDEELQESVQAKATTDTLVEDSDDEAESKEPVQDVEVEAEPVVKKVVKKVVSAPAPVEQEAVAATEPAKKKVVKKKAT